MADNRVALADLTGRWIDGVQERKPRKSITLDMGSSVSPIYGAQEGTARNGTFGRMCYCPLVVFNQIDHLKRRALRVSNVLGVGGFP